MRRRCRRRRRRRRSMSMRRSDLFLSIIVLYFVFFFFFTVVFCDIQRVCFFFFFFFPFKHGVGHLYYLGLDGVWFLLAWDGMVVYQKSLVGLIDTIDVHIYIHINNYMVILNHSL